MLLDRDIDRSCPHRLRASLLLAVCFLAGAPASAEVDLSGIWGFVRNEDILRNPHPGDYGGMPLTAAGQQRANTWDATIQKMQIWQCRPHPIGYWARSPHNVLIQREIDPATRELVAFHLQMSESTVATVHMDGRPHPSKYAMHTWNGFSTGEWVSNGSILKVTRSRRRISKRATCVATDRCTATRRR